MEEEKVIHVYDYESLIGDRSFQFTRLTDFLSWANDNFDCERMIATTDYDKIRELEQGEK
jgi:hypothetical protein